MSILKILNPGQSIDNTFKVMISESGCCPGEGLTISKFLIAGPITNVSEIKFKLGEVEKTVVFPIASAFKDIRMALAKALSENGFNPYFEDSYKGISVTADHIAFIGEAEILTVTVNNVVKNATKLSNMSRICRITGTANISTPLGDLAFGNNVGTPVGDANGYLATEIAALKTDLTTALVAQNLTANKVEVSVNLVSNKFTFILHVPVDLGLTLDGTDLILLGCYPDFI